MADRFLIAPLDGGLQNGPSPWLIPDRAFYSMRNSYVSRGKVKKRVGGRLMTASTSSPLGLESNVSRLRVKIATTDGIGNIPLNTVVPGEKHGAGVMFSIGDTTWTCTQASPNSITPATIIKNGANGTASYNSINKTFDVTLALFNTPVYFYPSSPVMGIATYETVDINQEQTIAFDTQFAYKFTISGWERLGDALFTGSSSDLIWSTNHRSEEKTGLFVSNYKTNATGIIGSDRMKVWNGTTWKDFSPGFDMDKVAGESFILSARCIVSFADRLLLFNTVENVGAAPGTNTTYVNRCRISWNGDPLATSSGGKAKAFDTVYPGGGTFIDFPTREAIVSVQSLYNRLIVFCERSTYEMVVTHNPATPFVVQLINGDLGANSTFSPISFDKDVLAIGESSINTCSGTNVNRIDTKIPDEIFSIKNSGSDVKRIVGIRDFYTEMTFWSIPSSNKPETVPYNDEVLVYNYIDGTWAINNDSITAFGYYQVASSSVPAWSSTKKTWAEMAIPWRGLSTKANFKSVLAGNQQGFMFIVDSDVSSNSESLYVTNMIATANEVTITSYNHNLKVNSYFQLKNATGDITITSMNDTVYKIISVIDADSFKISATFSNIYNGGGTIIPISIIDIVTKQYNFYLKEGSNFNINKIDILIDKTSDGELSVDYFSSTSNNRDGTATIETSPYGLISQEHGQTRLWRSFYPITHGNCIQMKIYQSEKQLLDPIKALSDFTLHAIMFYTSRCSSRLQ